MAETDLVPNTLWPVGPVKEADLYFYLEQTEELLADHRVRVTGHGEMVMLGGYSYLGLLGDERINTAAAAAINTFGTGALGTSHE